MNRAIYVLAIIIIQKEYKIRSTSIFKITQHKCCGLQKLRYNRRHFQQILDTVILQYRNRKIIDNITYQLNILVNQQGNLSFSHFY